MATSSGAPKLPAPKPAATPKPAARQIKVYPFGPDSKPVVLTIVEGEELVKSLDHREAKDFGLALRDAVAGG